MTPQARWSRRQKRKGRCPRCGQRRNKYRQLCDTCQRRFTEYMRVWRAIRKIKRGLALVEQAKGVVGANH